MAQERITRGEKIKNQIESIIAKNRERKISCQRTDMEVLIDHEEKRVYAEAEKWVYGSPIPKFDITLKWVPVPEILEEFRKKGFKIELSASEYHVTLADD